MDVNRLPLERRAQIIGMLAEGTSLRTASRLADVSINTVTKLLVDVGAACEEYQDRTLRGGFAHEIESAQQFGPLPKKSGSP